MLWYLKKISIYAKEMLRLSITQKLKLTPIKYWAYYKKNIGGCVNHSFIIRRECLLDS
jgi:hypothetical protein